MRKFLLPLLLVLVGVGGFFHAAEAAVMSSQMIVGSSTPFYGGTHTHQSDGFAIASSTQSSSCVSFSGDVRSFVIQVVNDTNSPVETQYGLEIQKAIGGTYPDVFATSTLSTIPHYVTFQLPISTTVGVNCATGVGDLFVVFNTTKSFALLGTNFTDTHIWFGSFYSSNVFSDSRPQSTFLPYYIMSDTTLSPDFLTSITEETATSSSLFSGSDATSTLAALAQQCSQQSNAFAEAICVGFSFLFVPAPVTIGQYSNLSPTLQSKFPFSYVVSAVSTWNSLVGSSTANAPKYQYQLGDLGLGSTTPMGNLLPNIDVLSSTTVQSMFPPGMFAALKALASFAIILTLIADIFFTSRNLMH